jgi:Tfp pilus assembly protein PilN
MINLLPEQQKRELSREYRRRLLVVAVAFCVGVITIAAVLLIPSYLFSLYQEQGASAATAAANRSTDGQSTQLLSQVAALRTTIAVLDADSSAKKVQPTVLIATIIKDLPAGDAINSFGIDAGGGNLVINLAGVAMTRESLEAFTDALKGESAIASVDLPISNLAADTDVSFNIVVTANS